MIKIDKGEELQRQRIRTQNIVIPTCFGSSLYNKNSNVCVGCKKWKCNETNVYIECDKFSKAFGFVKLDKKREIKREFNGTKKQNTTKYILE